MDAAFTRMARALERRAGEIGLNGTPFALRLRDGAPVAFGDGEPAFTVVVNDRRGLAALASLDVTAAGEAYLDGALDLEGDVQKLLALRDLFTNRHPLRYAYRFVRPLLFGQVASDRKWIARHYDEDPDFFLLFLDRRHRCYSQGVFARDDEPLEDAITRKLDFAFEAARIEPGQRVLDIGGGWGAFTEYAGKRGVHVTSLTISKQSEAFINELIAREGLPCEVRLEHFFDHRPAAPYDAIVNLGVTEHLPDYPATLARYHALLKPGGRVYLDASAARAKHQTTDFFERHIYQGNGSQLCLHDYVAALSRTPLELEAVYNDRHNYALTTRGWAENLDRHREEIESRWGRAQYRKFQLYLWGCVDGFTRDIIQAYRLVLHRP
ncbi:MAG TPA: class I SAM-dependent methyltransferase [Rubricoccaceae bacterium]|jgi:cyclopropane-fatty-acyl-phospholipid synthase|nr:class I SAM-dependent methyltransferase [Rubricoccaceae bacterium]